MRTSRGPEEEQSPQQVQEQKTNALPQLSETEKGIVERSGTSGTAEQRVKAWQEYRQASENTGKVQIEVRQLGNEAKTWQHTRAMFLPYLAAKELRDAEQKLQGFGVNPEQVTQQVLQSTSEDLRDPAPPAVQGSDELLQAPDHEQQQMAAGQETAAEPQPEPVPQTGSSSGKHGYQPPTVEDVPEQEAAPAHPDAEVSPADLPETETDHAEATQYADVPQHDETTQQQAAQQQEQEQEQQQEEQPPSAARSDAAAALDDLRADVEQLDSAHQEFEERLDAHPDLHGAPQAAAVRDWYATARTSEPQVSGLGDLAEQLDTRLHAAERENFAQGVAHERFERHVASAVPQISSFPGGKFQGSPQAQQLKDEFTAAAVPRVHAAEEHQDAGTGPLDELVEDFRPRYEQAYRDWREDQMAHAAFHSATEMHGREDAADIALGSQMGDPDAIAWYGDQVGRLEQGFVQRWKAAGQDTAGPRPTPEQAHDKAEAKALSDAAQRTQEQRGSLTQDLRRNALDLMAQARKGGRLDADLREIAEHHAPFGHWHPRAADWYKRERRALLKDFTDGLRRQGPGARDTLAADFRRQLGALQEAGSARNLAHQDFDGLVASQESAGTAPARPETRSWMREQTKDLRNAYVQARLAEQTAAQAEAWRSEDTTGRRPELIPSPSHIGADDWRNATWQAEQIRLHEKYGAELAKAADEYAAEQASFEQAAAEHGTLGRPAPEEGPYALAANERSAFGSAFGSAFAAWSQGTEGKQVPEALQDQVRRGVLNGRAREVFTQAEDSQDLAQRLADAFTREGVLQVVLDHGHKALDRINAATYGTAQDQAFEDGSPDALTRSPRVSVPEAAMAYVWPLLKERLTDAVHNALPVGSDLRVNPQEATRLGMRLWREALGWAKDQLAGRVAYEQAVHRIDQVLDNIAAQPQEQLDAGAHALFAAFEDGALRNHEAGDDAVARPRFGSGDLQLSSQGWTSVRSSAQTALDEAFHDTFDGEPAKDTEQSPAHRLDDWQQRADKVLGGLPGRVAHQALREGVLQAVSDRSGEALESWQPQQALGQDSAPRFGELTGAPLTIDVHARVQASLVREALDLYKTHFGDGATRTAGLEGQAKAFSQALGKLIGQQELDARILREATWEAARQQGRDVFDAALKARQTDPPSHLLTSEHIARVRAGHDARVQAAFVSVVGPALSRPQGLSAKSGPWSAELHDLASVLPDHFAFEVEEGAALHGAGKAFTALHDDRPMTESRLEGIAKNSRDDWLNARKLFAPRTVSGSWGEKEAATTDAFSAGRTAREVHDPDQAAEETTGSIEDAIDDVFDDPSTAAKAPSDETAAQTQQEEGVADPSTVVRSGSSVPQGGRLGRRYLADLMPEVRGELDYLLGKGKYQPPSRDEVARLHDALPDWIRGQTLSAQGAAIAQTIVSGAPVRLRGGAPAGGGHEPWGAGLFGSSGAGSSGAGSSGVAGRPEFSRPPSVSSEWYSSDDEDPVSKEFFKEEYTRFGRETTFTPQPTVGFGSSLYGPRPEDMPLARSGELLGDPSAGAEAFRIAYRFDLEPLFRWDSRSWEVIFVEGFRPHNGKRPVSLRFYQAEHIDTALVSTTRDGTFAEEGARPEWAMKDGRTYRYTINAPGGYDFLGSLPRYAYANQQEVAFWKGVRPEFISGVAVFDDAGNVLETVSNPNAHAAREVEAERQERDRQQYLEYLRAEVQRELDGLRGKGWYRPSRDEVEQFRDALPDWIRGQTLSAQGAAIAQTIVSGAPVRLRGGAPAGGGHEPWGAGLFGSSGAGPSGAGPSGVAGRPEFSRPPSVSSEWYSSDDEDPVSKEFFKEEYTRFGRETTFTPQPTVGFGSSLYGPRPEDMPLARSGELLGDPSAGAEAFRIAYRFDLEPLFRWDSRSWEVIFVEGFRPHNGKRPVSLRFYQAEHIDTALVSTTRDGTFAEEGARPEWAMKDGRTYRYTINAPGGYDFLGSLPRYAYANQQEVAFWKGVRPEFISGVTVFDDAGNVLETVSNPNAHAAREVEAERQERDRQQYLEYLRAEVQRELDGLRGKGWYRPSRDEVEQFRDALPDWIRGQTLSAQGAAIAQTIVSGAPVRLRGGAPSRLGSLRMGESSGRNVTSAPRSTPRSTPLIFPPPADTLEEFRPYDRQGSGLDRAQPAEQQNLEDVFPRDERGDFQRFPDPRGASFSRVGLMRSVNRAFPTNRHGTSAGSARWIEYINPQAAATPTRQNNCEDASRSVLVSWQGRPTVAAPTQSRGPNLMLEENSRQTTSRWLGSGWRRHDFPDHMSDAERSRGAWASVEGRLLRGGHGSSAIIDFQRPNGNMHSVNALNYGGQVFWVDGAYGRVSDRPLYEGVHFFSIELDPDMEAIDGVPWLGSADRLSDYSNFSDSAGLARSSWRTLFGRGASGLRIEPMLDAPSPLKEAVEGSGSDAKIHQSLPGPRNTRVIQARLGTTTGLGLPGGAPEDVGSWPRGEVTEVDAAGVPEVPQSESGRLVVVRPRPWSPVGSLPPRSEHPRYEITADGDITRPGAEPLYAGGWLRQGLDFVHDRGGRLRADTGEIVFSAAPIAEDPPAVDLDAPSYRLHVVPPQLMTEGEVAGEGGLYLVPVDADASAPAVRLPWPHGTWVGSAGQDAETTTAPATGTSSGGAVSRPVPEEEPGLDRLISDALAAEEALGSMAASDETAGQDPQTSSFEELIDGAFAEDAAAAKAVPDHESAPADEASSNEAVSQVPFTSRFPEHFDDFVGAPTTEVPSVEELSALGPANEGIPAPPVLPEETTTGRWSEWRSRLRRLFHRPKSAHHVPDIPALAYDAIPGRAAATLPGPRNSTEVTAGHQPVKAASEAGWKDPSAAEQAWTAAARAPPSIWQPRRRRS
ncbi:toxin glutamine deamidase domain-containing protein [Streptomyces lydicus]|nr:toxin glutamine deamidase domain-containing protein [Streptomyces lydicus]